MSLERLQASGLTHQLGPSLPKRMELRGSTPDGSIGVLCVLGGEQIGYYPDRQTWRRMRDGVWCGMWNDSPPTLDELAVVAPLAGHEVQMRDGRRWQVPIAREWSSETSSYVPRVPAALDYDVDAQAWIRGAVEARFIRLWEVSGKRIDSLFGSGESLTVAAATDWALDALAVNYRISHVEASMLRLFDDQGLAALEVLDACCDVPTMREWLQQQKKTDPAAGELNLSDGVAA